MKIKKWKILEFLECYDKCCSCVVNNAETMKNTTSNCHVLALTSYAPTDLTSKLHILLFTLRYDFIPFVISSPYVYLPFRHWKYAIIKINWEIKYSQGSLPPAKNFVNNKTAEGLCYASPSSSVKILFCKAQSFQKHTSGEPWL